MKNKLLFILSFCLFCSQVFSLDVSARVLDESETALQNVIISCEGRTVVTDQQGRFRMSGVQPDSRLVLRKIGYQEISFSATELPARIYLKIAAIPIESYKVSVTQKNLILPEILPAKVIKIAGSSRDQDLADILAQEAGLQIKGNNLTGEQKQIIIPGFKAKHTLVMLDGIPLNKPGEAYDISKIPAALIDQVEIYDKSTLAAGSGSMGGVINLRSTKKFRENVLTIGSGTGSFGLFKLSATLSARLMSFDLLFSYSRRAARNDFKYKAKAYWENPDSLRTRKYNDKILQDVSLSFKNYNIPLSYSMIYQDFFKKLPGPTNNPDLYSDGRISGNSQRHTLSLENSNSVFFWNNTVSYYREFSIYDNTRISEIYQGYYVKNKTDYDRLDLKTTFGIKTEETESGIGFYLTRQSFRYREITDPDDSISRIVDHNLAFTANLDRKIHLFPFVLQLHSSVRGDHFSKDDQLSWLLMPLLEFNSVVDLELGISWGKSFTVPSYYDLYWKGDTQATGNPELEAETSRSQQILFKIDHYLGKIEINYRQDDIKNLIIWFQDFNKTWKPLNISGAEVQNLMFSGEFIPWQHLSLDGSVTFTETSDRSLTADGEHSAYWGKDLIYTPEYLLNLNLKFLYHNLRTRLNYARTGQQWINRDQLSDNFRLPEYDLWNADLRYRFPLFSLEAETSLLLKNMADIDYEIYEYSPQPGFNWEINFNVKYEL